MNGHLQKVAYAAAREYFPLFLRKVFAELCPGDHFSFGWHLDAIAYQLERVANGDVRRLIVTLPPRHLKSIATSIAWVAWWLGKAPDMRFICVSYSNELAAKLARDCRQVMQSSWYQNLFPSTVLSRATEMELETTAGGGRLATSIGGTMTGRGGDVIIIDDPMKADEAMSVAARAQAKDWTTSTLFSRLNDKQTGAVILVMQRLHQDDLAGHMLEAGGWEHLNLPAIAQEEQIIPLLNERVHVRAPGDVLHPERESRETLDQIAREVGSYVFAAQYQQAPVPAGGALVQRKWLRYYDKLPKKQPGDQLVQSWDTASKDGALNDYSVCLTALVRRNDVYILDVFHAQLNFPDLLRQVQMQAERHSPDILLIEDAASGQQLIQHLEIVGICGVPSPIRCKPVVDKITRLYAGCALIEAGGLILPEEAHWRAGFESELLAFPKGRRDDQVDAVSQLIEWVRARPKIPIVMAWLSEDEHGFDYE